MTDGEEKIVGPIGIWKFPLLSRAFAKEQAKGGEETGFLQRTMERAPGIIISNAGKTAGAIAGSAAKEAVTERMAGGILSRFGPIL